MLSVPECTSSQCKPQQRLVFLILNIRVPPKETDCPTRNCVHLLNHLLIGCWDWDHVILAWFYTHRRDIEGREEKEEKGEERRGMS